jgi:phosphoribosylamine--glycine ligase
MIDPNGNPKVLEFNCRLGDPETQPILMRLQSDLIALCVSAIEGRIDDYSLEWDSRYALGVVMVADGYPGDYPRGDEIHGLDEINSSDIKVFHAGTRTEHHKILTDGGRVLCVTALGQTLIDAQKNAYSGVGSIQWSGAGWRPDIGWRAV